MMILSEALEKNGGLFDDISVVAALRAAHSGIQRGANPEHLQYRRSVGAVHHACEEYLLA